jgi:hypothetical protein
MEYLPTPLWTGLELTRLGVIIIDYICIGSCKSKYHAITTTMATTIYIN